MSETQENYKMAKRILTPAPDTEGEREGYRPRYEPAPAGWTMMEADRKNRRSLWLCEDGVKDWFYWDAPIAAASEKPICTFPGCPDSDVDHHHISLAELNPSLVAAASGDGETWSAAEIAAQIEKTESDIFPSDPVATPSQYGELVTRAKKASVAVYLAAEENAAKDISEILRLLVAAITALQSEVEWWKQEYRTAHDMWELKADKCSELQADYDAVQEAYSRCQSQAEASIAERLKSERIERDTRQVYNFALTTIKAQRAEIERWKKATAFEEGQVDADQATIAALKSALEEVCATYTTYSGNKGVSMYNAARLALAKDVK